MLVAIGLVGRNKNREMVWRCLCDCGKLKEVASSRLRGGYTRSCGCLQRDAIIARNTTHGKSKSRVYSIWKNMIKRCYNTNHEFFADYGGRGIQVCDRWKIFINFFADMGDPPLATMALDRIEVDGDYELNNCRWATWAEQNNNKRQKK